MIVVWWIVQVSQALAIVLCLLRLLKGPTMANRVVALDLLAVLAVGFMAAQAVLTEQWALIDVGIGIGIIAFIGTASFALLIDRDPGASDDT